jgi:hypothetical protein
LRFGRILAARIRRRAARERPAARSFQYGRRCWVFLADSLVDRFVEKALGGRISNLALAQGGGLGFVHGIGLSVFAAAVGKRTKPDQEKARLRRAAWFVWV